MPYPKISGLLNNCPLNTQTPEILAEINRIAENPNTYDPLYLHAYETLKNDFISFYHLENTLSWEEFSQLLSTYNPYDIQLILSPVLRRVMAIFLEENLEDSTSMARFADPDCAEDENNARFITKKTTLQAHHARYDSLSPDELFCFISKRFGFNLSYVRDGVRRDFYLDNPEYHNRPEIVIYHQGGIEGAEAGGHWERVPVGALEQPVFYERETSSRLKHIDTLFHYDTQHMVQIGFNYIAEHIQLTLHRIRHPDADDALQFRALDLSATQINKFMYNVCYVDRQFSVELLGAITEKTRNIIRRIPIPNTTYDSIYRELVDINLPENMFTPRKSRRTADDPRVYDIVLRLLTPPQIDEPNVQAESLTERLMREWELRLNDINALPQVHERFIEHILYEEGLSKALYSVCNRETVSGGLSNEIVNLLRNDPDFETRASLALKQRVSRIEATNSSSALDREETSGLEIMPELKPNSPGIVNNNPNQSSVTETAQEEEKEEKKDDDDDDEQHEVLPSEITSDSSQLPADPNALRLSMNRLILSVKAHISSQVWIGVSQTWKSTKLDQLMLRNADDNNDLNIIYQELVAITTTHRTRFGLFYYISRNNNSKTQTAIALSRELIKSEYQALKNALNIAQNTPLEIRNQFDTEIAGQDYYSTHP